jgi:hypothetical protein
VPKLEGVPFRKVDQQLDKLRCPREIAHQDGDRGSRVGQRKTQRIGVIDNLGLSDAGLGSSQGLIGKTLNPEYTRKVRKGADALIQAEADSMRSVKRGNVAVEHPLDVGSRIGLIAKKMQRNADDPITGHGACRIAPALGKLPEPLGDGEGGRVAAGTHAGKP